MNALSDGELLGRWAVFTEKNRNYEVPKCSLCITHAACDDCVPPLSSHSESDGK